MFDRPEVSLDLRPVAEGVVLVDRSCGDCAVCAAGATLWCRCPLEQGRDLAPAVAAHRAAALGEVLSAAAAFLEAPPASSALVVDEEDGPLAILIRALCDTQVLVAPDPFAASLKAQLAELEPTGRASVVVVRSDAKAAVKAVRRGGHVCVGDPDGPMPSVTELVQREVTLIGPRSVAGLIHSVGAAVWDAAVRAA